MRRDRSREAREKAPIDTALDQLLQLDRRDVIAFADAAAEAVRTTSLTYRQLQPILESRAIELREALRRHPGNVNLRKLYLRGRIRQQEEQDAFRGKCIRSACFAGVMYGTWAVYAWLTAMSRA